MEIFILILFFSGTGKALTSIDFTSKEKCNYALSESKKLSSFGISIDGICVEK